ncbi:Smoothelin-like protein 2 [Halotydeus destructor]|nr:Smoothelin-like protein 2 [Halotydeus destructor]
MYFSDNRIKVDQSQSKPEVRLSSGAVGGVARSPTDVKDALLRWCRSKTKEYENVQITNFSSSWADGLAFCALVHHFYPDAFDYSTLDAIQRRKNFDLAFRVAEEKADIMPLLEADDMILMKNKPDWKCVFTYVHSMYRELRKLEKP